MTKLSRRKNIFIILVFLIIISTIYIKKVYFSKNNSDVQNESEFPEKIQLSKEIIENSKIMVVTLQKESFVQTISLVGEVSFDPDRVAQISARIPGRILKVDFVEGSQVKLGQSLVEMESPDASRLRSKYLSSYNKAMVAERNMKRVKELSVMRLVSDQEVLNAEGEYRVLDSELKMDKTNLQVQGIPIPDSESKSDIGLGKIIIRSPLNGIALSRDAIPGKQVDIGNVLGVVGDISQVWFLVKIFEKDLSVLLKNTEANITLNAIPDTVFQGKLEHIGNQVDVGTRTLSGRIILHNPELKAKIGLFGKAEIKVGNKEVVTIPRISLFDWKDKKYVFLQVSEYSFTPREVKIGDTNSERVEVISGITEGDRIVSEGMFTLKSIFLKTTFGEE